MGPYWGGSIFWILQGVWVGHVQRDPEVRSYDRGCLGGVSGDSLEKLCLPPVEVCILGYSRSWVLQVKGGT